MMKFSAMMRIDEPHQRVPEELKKEGQSTPTIKGTHHTRKFTHEQQRALDSSHKVVESVANLVLGAHLTKTEVQISQIANKMFFALGSQEGRVLVAHNKHGYQVFQDNEQTIDKNEYGAYRGAQYCDVSHNGKYYFLVSGVSNGTGGRLYLLREDLEHPKFPLISHHYDSPFFGKSIYPNPFDPQMTIFCDPCYGWFQAFILGPDEAVQAAIVEHEKEIEERLAEMKEEEKDMYYSWRRGQSEFNVRAAPVLENRSDERHTAVSIKKDWVTSFNFSLFKNVDNKYGDQEYIAYRDGIIFGNSWDNSMGHVISSICFLAKDRLLALVAPSNEIVELKIDVENRKFVQVSRKNFTKAFKQNEQSTAMAICPRQKYIVISTRNALNQSRGDYETNLFLYLFRYSKKTGLNFYARFTLNRPKNVASIHDLIFHGYNRNRLIITANQYNISDRGTRGEITKGIVSTYMIDFRLKRLSFMRSVYLMGDNEQIGSWYRDGSEVISLDNKGAFVRIKL